MYQIKASIALSAAVLVGACSATPPPDSVLRTGYKITQNGSSVTTTGSPSIITGGLLSWNQAGLRAYIQDEADFVAAAAVDKTDNNRIYSGISGIAATDVPIGGTATYTGRYGVIRVTAAHGGGPWGFVGTQTSNVNFLTGSVVGSGGSDGFAYSANISGTSISGTVSFTGDGAVTAPLEGGFYGADTLAGAFSADTITGLFYGTAP